MLITWTWVFRKSKEYMLLDTQLHPHTPPHPTPIHPTHTHYRGPYHSLLFTGLLCGQVISTRDIDYIR